MESNEQQGSPSPMLSKEFAGQASEYVQEMLKAGAQPREILKHLASAAEVLAGPGTATSILVLDRDGFLRNGASANLPPDYLAAIDGLKPDPNVGTCAAAAATGSVVITRISSPTINGRSCATCLSHWVLSGPGACRSSLRQGECWAPSAPTSASGVIRRRRSAEEWSFSPARPH